MTSARPVLRWSLVALAAAAVAISCVLWAITSSPVLASSLCPSTAKFNCESVLSSDLAKWRGIPLSALGLLYFGFLGLWYAVVGLSNVPGRSWQLVPLLVNLFGLAISV